MTLSSFWVYSPVLGRLAGVPCVACAPSPLRSAHSLMPPSPSNVSESALLASSHSTQPAMLVGVHPPPPLCDDELLELLIHIE